MNAKQLKGLLLSQVEDAVRYLLPNGKRHGSYWCCGSVRGEKGDSLKVCLTGAKAGVWLDGAEQNERGDIFDLWIATKGLHNFKEAYPAIKEFLGVRDHAPKFETQKRYQKPKRNWSQLTEEGITYMQSRGIDEIPKGYYVLSNTDGVICFVYDYPKKEARMAKYLAIERDEEGRKKVWSTPESMPILFGMCSPLVQNSRWLVIDEGEINALSYASQGIPAVSVPFGAKGEGSDGSSPNDEWISNCYEFLQQYETIFLSFDQDHAGQEAIQAIIPRLGRERCRVVTHSEGVDANDLLLQGVNLRELLKEANTQDPEDLTPGDRLMERTWNVLRKGRREEQGIVPFDWVFPRREEFRIRPREGSLITGWNHAGKSNFAYQLMAWLAHVKGHNVFIGSYEEPADEIMSLMTYHIVGRRIEREEYRLFSQLTETFRRIVVHDYEGTLDWHLFFEYAHYAVARYGCQHVLLDGLSSMTLDLDDKTEMAQFTKQAQAFWKETGVHLWVICHPRKGFNEDFPPGKQDIKGSGYLMDLFFNVIIMFRTPPTKPHSAEFIVQKQKVGGHTPHLEIEFHKDSYRFVQLECEQEKWE